MPKKSAFNRTARKTLEVLDEVEQLGSMHLEVWEEDGNVNDELIGKPASDYACVVCGVPAVAFWPVGNSDISCASYCRACLDRTKVRMFLNNQEHVYAV